MISRLEYIRFKNTIWLQNTIIRHLSTGELRITRSNALNARLYISKVQATPARSRMKTHTYFSNLSSYKYIHFENSISWLLIMRSLLQQLMGWSILGLGMNITINMKFEPVAGTYYHITVLSLSLCLFIVLCRMEQH